MDARFNSRSNNNNNNPSFSEEDDTDVAESPPSAIFNIDSLVPSTSSPKRSRRAIKKRVVQIPIKDVDGSRLRGESKTPPSDSWAWRKYGQKPIKGSPYPRGYYRCSSSKGCPARKQVERSRMDPTMLVVTYSYEHNHPWPASRKNHHHRNSNVNSASATDKLNIKSEHDIQTDPEPEPDSEEKFAGPSEDSLIATANEYGWFGEMELAGTTSSVVWESRMYTGDDADVGSVLFPMGEEDESLFAELGELPECSVVFGRGLMQREDERRRRCGTTRGGAGLFGTLLEDRD